jgi:NADPH:quinone reductase-like Zn-dependent oxidoreductase
MRTIRFHAYGPASKLRVDEVADPAPADEGVVVRVRAAGVNHWDVDMRNGSSGLELRLPHAPGLEVAGDVVAMGPGVTGWLAGERVMPRYLWPCRRCEWCATHQENHCARIRMLGVTEPGGYSQYVAAPAAELVRLPAGVSYEEAAALQCTYGPVWHALKSRLQLKPGTTILINAAGSGVGSAGIQIAKLLGAWIIASAGSDDKLARAKAEGAEAIINYRTEDLAERVRELTSGKGVQAVLDCVGGHIFEASVAALAPVGRAVSLGAHSGVCITMDLVSLFRTERSIIGSANCTPSDIDTVMGLLAEKKIRPNIYRTYPLENAALAHTELEARRHYGKLLLIP